MLEPCCLAQGSGLPRTSGRKPGKSPKTVPRSVPESLVMGVPESERSALWSPKRVSNKSLTALLSIEGVYPFDLERLQGAGVGGFDASLHRHHALLNIDYGPSSVLTAGLR